MFYSIQNLACIRTSSVLSLGYECGGEPVMRLVECLSTFLESEAFSAVGGLPNFIVN